jgi:hypothetical protein
LETTASAGFPVWASTASTQQHTLLVDALQVISGLPRSLVDLLLVLSVPHCPFPDRTPALKWTESFATERPEVSLSPTITEVDLPSAGSVVGVASLTTVSPVAA